MSILCISELLVATRDLLRDDCTLRSFRLRKDSM